MFFLNSQIAYDRSSNTISLFFMRACIKEKRTCYAEEHENFIWIELEETNTPLILSTINITPNFKDRN